MANSMGSLFIGASGLKTSQNALNATANNFANIDTKGYVRERVLQADRNYDTFLTTAAIAPSQSGLGVEIGDVIHARNMFYDKVFRTQTGRSGFYSSTFEAVSEVETLFQELHGTAFQEVLDGPSGFRLAFAEFAKDPTNRTNQNLVIQKADLFVSRSLAIYNRLKNYQSNLNDQISNSIDKINELGAEIKNLNREIMKIEGGGVETAMDLRDQRDLCLDELASYGDIRYKELASGAVKVSFEGVAFVDDRNVFEIGKQIDDETGFITPYWKHLSDAEKEEYYKIYDVSAEISTAKKNDIGSLKGLLLARGYKYAGYRDLAGISLQEYDKTLGNSVLMNAEAEIDMLVHTVVTEINNLYAPNIASKTAITGTDEKGNTVSYPPGKLILDAQNCSVGADGALPPQELFERTGCTRYTTVTGDDGKTYYVYNEPDPTDPATHYAAGSVRVNPKLLESESLLPAYTQNGRGTDQPEARKMVEALAALWDKDTMFLNPHDTMPCTFSEFYSKMTGELSTLGDVFRSISEGLEGTARATENARQQVIGVSSDEELTNMIKFQNAYNASSRFINVISEMIDTIINRMG